MPVEGSRQLQAVARSLVCLFPARRRPRTAVVRAAAAQSAQPRSARAPAGRPDGRHQTAQAKLEPNIHMSGSKARLVAMYRLYN
eukprot:10443073-Heterocapsa_arctica.AAC.1